MQESKITAIAEAMLKAEEDEREAEAQTFRRIVTKYERQLERKLKGMFHQQKKEVLSNLDMMKDLTDFLMFDVGVWTKNLELIVQPHIRKAFQENGERVFNDLPDIGKSVKDVMVEAGATFDMEYPEAIEYIENHSVKLADDVTETTQAKIAAVLKQGFDEGLTIKEIAAEVTDSFNSMSTYRALSIARTEMSRAANQGALSAYKQSRVVEAKEWLTARDEKTCPFCNAKDAEVQGLSDSFLALHESLTVGEATMTNNYLDVQAPPIHTSCRCSLLPVIKTITF